MTKLSPEEDAILEHVARYRLTLPEILANASILAGADVADAAVRLEALVDRGWLGKSPLRPGYGDEAYFHLNARAARHLGQDTDFGKPLPRDARIDAYAIAVFCTTSPERQLLTKQEFMEKFSRLWFAGQPVRYALERKAGSRVRLAFLKVDRDGAGRWDRLIDSCARFLQQRTDPQHVAAAHRPRVEAFAELVRRGQFQFTVLTALDEKQRAIELELERRAVRGQPVPLYVHVVPGLLSLLFPELPDPRLSR